MDNMVPSHPQWKGRVAGGGGGGGGKGRIKPFCYEPLRLGSHQPILTDADIGHNGCSDDGMREARGDEQKR